MVEKSVDVSRFFTNTKKNIHFFSEKMKITLTLIWWKWYNCIVQSFGKDDKSQTLGLIFFGRKVILNNLEKDVSYRGLEVA